MQNPFTFLLEQLEKTSSKNCFNILELIDKKSALIMVRLVQAINRALIGKWEKMADQIKADLSNKRVPKSKIGRAKFQLSRLIDAVDHAQGSWLKYNELECLIREVDRIAPWPTPAKK